MKRFVLILAVSLLGISALVMLIKPVLIAFAKKKIEHILPDSRISVNEIKLNYTPWSLMFLSAEGDVLIDRLQRGKFLAKNINFKLRWEGNRIFIENLSGQILNGRFDGNGDLTAGSRPGYSLHLNFTNIDLGDVVEDFDIKDRVEMTGTLGGKLMLKGAGKRIDILNGDFAASESGGNVTIKDRQFLQNMARSSNLPDNIVVDSFQDYHYNIGSVRSSLDHGDLVMDVLLEGKTGKRNLKIDLHEFSLK